MAITDPNLPTAGLVANLSSLALDYAARQKVNGTHLTMSYLRQVPVFQPSDYDARCPWRGAGNLLDWTNPRALELIYTAYDVEPFARDLGDQSPPFHWDSRRRSLIRSELDAGYFHLYSIARDGVDYILDSFPVLRRKEETRFGEYRTKRLVLEVYDRMADSIRTGKPYQTILDPPPGKGPRHPAKQEGQ